ncbi:MAG: hypothetical protein PHD56_07820 [Anaerostipes sp.]|nr:hypothetical protein [Anaerostipes sp.]
MIDEKKLIEFLIWNKTEQKAEALDIDELIRYLNEDCEKVGEWTPVSEGLPKKQSGKDGEYYDFVLVTLNDGDVSIGVYRDDDKWWWTRHSHGGDGYVPRNNVVAWMPRPKPYRKEEENEINRNS